MFATALNVFRETLEAALFDGIDAAATRQLDGSGRWLGGGVGLGVGLGVVAGTVIYTGLARIPARHVFNATNVLIALLAGSMASQLMKSLAQAGFLEGGTAPVWDSSHLLAPDSPLGTLLHALVG